MAKFKILVPVLLMVGNKLGKYGEEFDGEAFADEPSKLIKEGYIEDVKAVKLTPAQIKAQKDADYANVLADKKAADELKAKQDQEAADKIKADADAKEAADKAQALIDANANGGEGDGGNVVDFDPTKNIKK